MITLHAIRFDAKCPWYVDPTHIVRVSCMADVGYYTIVQISTARDAWGATGATCVEESPEQVMALITPVTP